MTGLAVTLLILVIVSIAALLLAGVGGISAVLLVAGIAGAIYLVQHTRSRS